MSNQATRVKETELLLHAIHDPSFTTNILSLGVPYLINHPVLSLLASTVVRYYASNKELLTESTFSSHIEDYINMQNRKNEINHEPTLDGKQSAKIIAVGKKLFNAKPDMSNTMLDELTSYIRLQLTNNAILDEVSNTKGNLSERVQKRMDAINAIDLRDDKVEYLDVFNDIEKKKKLYDRFAKGRVPSGLKPFDLVTGGGLEKQQVGMIAGPQGLGKAQPYSENVMTPQGVVKMGNLHVGDKVYNRFGKQTTITNIFEKGKLDVYRVETTDGRVIKVNDEHLFSYFSKKRNGKSHLITKTLREMIDAGVIKKDRNNKPHHRYAIPINQAIEYPEVPVDYDPYTVGALIGDGSLTSKVTYISADEHKYFILDNIVRNNEVLENWKRNSDKNYTCVFTMKNKEGSHGRFIANNNDINLPDSIQKYTHLKKIPDELVHGSIKQREDVIRGLFDTDGSAYFKKDRNNAIHVGYSGTSEKLVDQILEVLHSLGYLASKHVDKRIYAYGGNCFTITVKGKSDSLAKLFTPNSLKYNKCIEANDPKNVNYDRTYIDTVTKLDYKEQMRCIMVNDEEHLYVSGSYFVSHNTAFLTNLSYYYSVVSNHNVLHISLEELENDQNLRFDRIMTNSSMHDVFDEEGHATKDFFNKVDKTYSKLKDKQVGRLIFEKHPTHTLTVEDLDARISYLENSLDLKFDVLILDYADLLNFGNGGFDSAYVSNAGEYLFEELSRLAQIHDIVIITGSQLNRGSSQAETLDMSLLQGSYKKKNVIAFGATINATPEEKKQGYVRLYLDKVRNDYGFDDQFMYLKYDKNSMKLHAENDSQIEEHKALVSQGISTKRPRVSKENKTDSMIDVLNKSIEEGL